MIISIDVREKALFDELKYAPPKTMREYTVAASSRMCGIWLDGEAEQCPNLDAGTDSPPSSSSNEPVVCKHEAHTLRKQRLVMGDAAIQNADADVILFERKTLVDLAASIRDGRYKEQSFRMNQYCELANHNVIYIVEGEMAKYTDKAKTASPITKKALYSAMFSMMYLKGFSVFRTANIRETADLILYFADKYDAVPMQERKPYYANKPPLAVNTDAVDRDGDRDDENVSIPAAPGNYSGMFKYKERSSQITPDNIGEIMISAVPFVNSKTAAAIMAEYKTVPNLIHAMQNDRACLDTIYIPSATAASKRKISKLCVDNLFKFLIG